MTYQEFVNKYNGKFWDFDGCYGVQCCDLANYYFTEVFGIPKTDLFKFANACNYYSDFTAFSGTIQKKFTRIANMPEFVPKKGDVVVWKSTLNGGPGHIAIATGEGDTNYFYSYDQNWTGNHDKMTKVKHNYNHVYGVLRPIDQSKITGGKTSSTVKGANSIGTVLRPDYYVITADTLNVRSEPNTSAKIVGTKKKGTQVYCYSFCYGKNTTWAKIDGGYICINENTKNYVRVNGVVQGDVVNVRKTPGGAICGSVNKGKKLLLTKECNGWSYSPEAGGWISNEYLR